jgi:riboflavin synthase
MRSDGRLDGHIVKGHVDTVGKCEDIQILEGSWYYKFRFPAGSQYLVVDKGSICVNGVSLTVVDPVDDYFSVAIIPYTYEHTNFHKIKVGDPINLEFDIIGKYLARYAKLYLNAK